MKNPISIIRSGRTDFTLIELLVVIAVIGILAGMLLAVSIGINRKGTVSKINAEMVQIVAAIEAYKSKYGFYPPGNTNNVHINPLYFELTGTVYTNDTRPGRGLGYTTLDGSYWVSATALYPNFRVNGFANSAASVRGDDEKPAPVNFLKELKAERIATNSTGGSVVRVLACSVGWDGPVSAPNSLCSWRYNSSNPTNNPGTFDLWVDVFLGDKTNRFSNWSKTPLIL